MILADDNQKPKKPIAKSLESIAALRNMMEMKLAQGPAGKVESESPAPEAKPGAAKPSANLFEKFAPPEGKMPDPAAWGRIMFRIAESSERLMEEFMARNRNLADVPPYGDPAHIGGVFLSLMHRVLQDPELLASAQVSLWQGYAKIWQSMMNRMQGRQAVSAIVPTPGDKRFQDEAWQSMWLFDFIKQSYLLTSGWVNGLVRKETEGLDPKLAHKIDFYTHQMIDAASPSNFWMTNPEVLRATFESGGENLVKGLENLLGDFEKGHGQLRITMSDPEAFKVGSNIAATKGKVIFQNDLMQLIQYSPLTPNVHSTPLLIVPPWINKYYILDLREKNSFIRYLIEQGHTVFCISWANPDGRHAKTSFGNYLDSGILTALREIKRATEVEQVNLLGYCIGGTLLAMALAYLKVRKETSSAVDRPDYQPRSSPLAGEDRWGVGSTGADIRHSGENPSPDPSRKGRGTQTESDPINIGDLPNIASATFLVAMTDFSEPGDLGVFIDEDQISAIEARMADKGYLEASSMSTTFNLLRANDLIWSFVINNYLLGKEPFPFDILYWNSDATNLPAAMHSFYLRRLYMENKLAEPGGVTMNSVPLDLRKIDTPVFMLSTQDDHIAPWRSTYAATQLYRGPVKFVLSGSGHIAGIVNPPTAKKYGYWTNDTCPEDPEDWFKDAAQHAGSWWPEWIKWLAQYGGGEIPAREVRDGLEDAPGSYVKVRAV